MANSVEKSGRTVQEAVALAIEELKTDESNVEIEVLEEGNKGLFGIIGNKMARVRVTVKESEAARLAKEFLYDVLDKIGVKAEIKTQEEEDRLIIQIRGSDCGIIIGRRGETLDSLQYLTNHVVNKRFPQFGRVIMDVEGYRKRREEALVKLANRLAEKAVRQRKNIVLEPMNPYERRIIHSSLQNHSYVETYSIGEEPNRKVVITLK